MTTEHDEQRREQALVAVNGKSIAAGTNNQSAFFDLNPRAMVGRASEMASVLVDIIEKQKLFTLIQGKKYVKHEGWATLGSMLGFLPREKAVVELSDGSFEAVVELYNVRTGQIVGQGSALCGIDEKRWGAAERYARRSMAITRATGKAYRLGFAWVMALAGYEPTPAEEMNDTIDLAQPPRKVSPAVVATPQKTVTPVERFNKNDLTHIERLEKKLAEREFPKHLYLAVLERLHGKEMVGSVLDQVLSETQREAPSDDAEPFDDLPFND